MSGNSSQTVQKLKQVAIDNKEISVRKLVDKNTKVCTESVS